MVEKTKRLNSSDTCEKEEVGMKWSFEDGVLKIKGDAVECPKEVNRELIEEIVFEPGTKEIVYRGFAGCTELRKIVLCEGIKKIESYAFDETWLDDVALPNSLESLGGFNFMSTQYVFLERNAPCLREVLENRLQPYFIDNYERWMNDYDGNLRSIINSYDSYKIQDGVLTVSGSCDIIDTLFSIDERNQIREIIVQEGVKGLGISFASDFENLESVVLPNSLSYISTRAFYNCQKLSSVKFGNNLIAVGYKAFALCPSLRGVRFPDSLRYLHCNAFDWNYLEYVDISESVKRFKLVDEFTFGRCRYSDVF